MPLIWQKNIEAVELYIWQITETEEELFNIISADLADFEIEKYKTFSSEKRRKEWLATRVLLKIALNKYQPIFYDNYGKPYLRNKQISISHSADLVCIGLSEKKFGVDIQQITDKAIKIKNKFLTSEEQKLITKKEEFTLFWTVKEAVYKFYGKKEVIFKKDIVINKKEKDKILVHFFGNTLIIRYLKIQNFYLAIAIYTIC